MCPYAIYSSIHPSYTLIYAMNITIYTTETSYNQFYFSENIVRQRHSHIYSYVCNRFKAKYKFLLVT